MGILVLKDELAGASSHVLLLPRYPAIVVCFWVALRSTLYAVSRLFSDG